MLQGRFTNIAQFKDCIALVVDDFVIVKCNILKYNLVDVPIFEIY